MLLNFLDKDIGVKNDMNKQIKRVSMIQLFIGKSLFLCILKNVTFVLKTSIILTLIIVFIRKSSGVIIFLIFLHHQLSLQHFVWLPCLHLYRFTMRKSSLKPEAGSDPSLMSSIDLEAETRRYSTTRNIFDRAVRPTQLGQGRPAWPGQL